MSFRTNIRAIVQRPSLTHPTPWTVDLRSKVAAESRAEIAYEHLEQFTDDPGIQDTLTFL